MRGVFWYHVRLYSSTVAKVGRMPFLFYFTLVTCQVLFAIVCASLYMKSVNIHFEGSRVLPFESWELGEFARTTLIVIALLWRELCVVWWASQRSCNGRHRGHVVTFLVTHYITNVVPITWVMLWVGHGHYMGNVVVVTKVDITSAV